MEEQFSPPIGGPYIQPFPCNASCSGVPSVQSAQADSEYLEEVVPHHMDVLVVGVSGGGVSTLQRHNSESNISEDSGAYDDSDIDSLDIKCKCPCGIRNFHHCVQPPPECLTLCDANSYPELNLKEGANRRRINKAQLYMERSVLAEETRKLKEDKFVDFKMELHERLQDVPGVVSRLQILLNIESSDYDSLFRQAAKDADFINYEPLEKIVKHCARGNGAAEKLLKDYQDAFHVFAQRRVFSFSEGSLETRTPIQVGKVILQIKIEEDFRRFLLDRIQQFKTFVKKILNLDDQAQLFVRSVREGCVELTFDMLEKDADKAFSNGLTLQQKREFAAHKISMLECNEKVHYCCCSLFDDQESKDLVEALYNETTQALYKNEVEDKLEEEIREHGADCVYMKEKRMNACPLENCVHCGLGVRICALEYHSLTCDEYKELSQDSDTSSLEEINLNDLSDSSESEQEDNTLTAMVCADESSHTSEGGHENPDSLEKVLHMHLTQWRTRIIVEINPTMMQRNRSTSFLDVVFFPFLFSVLLLSVLAGSEKISPKVVYLALQMFGLIITLSLIEFEYMVDALVMMMLKLELFFVSTGAVLSEKTTLPQMDRMMITLLLLVMVLLDLYELIPTKMKIIVVSILAVLLLLLLLVVITLIVTAVSVASSSHLEMECGLPSDQFRQRSIHDTTWPCAALNDTMEDRFIFTHGDFHSPHCFIVKLHSLNVTTEDRFIFTHGDFHSPYCCKVKRHSLNDTTEDIFIFHCPHRAIVISNSLHAIIEYGLGMYGIEEVDYPELLVLPCPVIPIEWTVTGHIVNGMMFHKHKHNHNHNMFSECYKMKTSKFDNALNSQCDPDPMKYKYCETIYHSIKEVSYREPLVLPCPVVPGELTATRHLFNNWTFGTMFYKHKHKHNHSMISECHKRGCYECIASVCLGSDSLYFYCESNATQQTETTASTTSMTTQPTKIHVGMSLVIVLFVLFIALLLALVTAYCIKRPFRSKYDGRNMMSDQEKDNSSKFTPSLELKNGKCADGDTLAIETSLSKGTDERDSTIESQGPSAPRPQTLVHSRTVSCH